MSLLTFRAVSLENIPAASSVLIGLFFFFACGDAVATRAEDDKMNHMHERIIKNKSDLRLAVSGIAFFADRCFLGFFSQCNSGSVVAYCWCKIVFKCSAQKNMISYVTRRRK